MQPFHDPAPAFRKATAVVAGKLIVDQLDLAARSIIAESPATSSVASAGMSAVS
jgi:hypothetical protein